MRELRGNTRPLNARCLKNLPKVTALEVVALQAEQ
jgi:hypothetical protein